MVVNIEDSAYNGMIEHAEEGYPNEVCGVMIGKGNTVSEYRRCRNLNRERAHDRYELDPLSFNEADEWARSNKQEILGIYHSHPDHPSLPSEVDRERAWPDWAYIILSVVKGSFSNARLWYINETSGVFEEKKFNIV